MGRRLGYIIVYHISQARIPPLGSRSLDLTCTTFRLSRKLLLDLDGKKNCSIKQAKSSSKYCFYTASVQY
jgi:hypothetical protein